MGKYIPNLVARPFEVTRSFAQAILDEVPSEPIAALLANDEAWEAAAADEDALARLLLIELLCWQFASPVRWIETQDLMFTPVEDGGLGVERLIEIGLGASPTLAGLGEKTLKLDEFSGSSSAALNVQRDEQVVTCVDVRFVDDEDEDATSDGGSAAADLQTSSAVATPSDSAKATSTVGTSADAAKSTSAPAPTSPSANSPRPCAKSSASKARLSGTRPSPTARRANSWTFPSWARSAGVPASDYATASNAPTPPISPSFPPANSASDGPAAPRPTTPGDHVGVQRGESMQFG